MTVASGGSLPQDKRIVGRTLGCRRFALFPFFHCTVLSTVPIVTRDESSHWQILAAGQADCGQGAWVKKNYFNAILSSAGRLLNRLIKDRRKSGVGLLLGD